MPLYPQTVSEHLIYEPNCVAASEASRHMQPAGTGVVMTGINAGVVGTAVPRPIGAVVSITRASVVIAIPLVGVAAGRRSAAGTGGTMIAAIRTRQIQVRNRCLFTGHTTRWG